MEHISLVIEPSVCYQTMDGFGANINPVGNWRNGALIPTLDLLIDDLGATLFRLDPYGFSNWVDVAGTADASILCEETYTRIYRSQPFQDAWAMARYFNQRGIKFILNVSGVVPRWMCASDGETLTDLEAYADLLTSLARWARYEEGIVFDLFGPFNETDLGPPEGPRADGETVARIVNLLIKRFAETGLEDVQLVLVDQARYNLDYLTQIVSQSQLSHQPMIAGMHCYGDFSLEPVHAFIEQHDLPWRYWLTEYGDLDQTGEREWQVALLSTRRLLRGLRDGVQAALVWDAYDNWHGHDDAWSIYGLLRTAIRVATPKKRYYAAKQVYRFVPPGSVRIAVHNAPAHLSVVAFLTPSGTLSLIGLNEGPSCFLDISIVQAPVQAQTFNLYLSTSQLNCELVATFPAAEQIAISVPGECIFTLA